NLRPSEDPDAREPMTEAYLAGLQHIVGAGPPTAAGVGCSRGSFTFLGTTIPGAGGSRSSTSSSSYSGSSSSTSGRFSQTYFATLTNNCSTNFSDVPPCDFGLSVLSTVPALRLLSGMERLLCPWLTPWSCGDTTTHSPEWDWLSAAFALLPTVLLCPKTDDAARIATL
ncbi:unnamed protein product, partial [Amoebophrya sp. A25]